MRKWIKRLVLLVMTIIVVLIGGGLVALWLVRTQPAFYRRNTLTPEQRAIAARSAEDKFIRIQNNAARLSAADSAASRGHTSGPISDDGPVTITFTDTELNSFFEKWSNFQNWKQSYEPYMDEPAIVLRDGRIILAAQLKDPDLVVSLHFEPRIDEHGKLQLELAKILGGRLPLPEVMIGKYERQASAALSRRLASWQNAADISSAGSANAAAISASMAKLFVHVLNHDAAEPVLYLPVIGQKGSVPVTIKDVKIDDGSITLTVQTMTAVERAALLEHIRQNDSTVADVKQ